jgi:hypothetical protein
MPKNVKKSKNSNKKTSYNTKRINIMDEINENDKIVEAVKVNQSGIVQCTLLVNNNIIGQDGRSISAKLPGKFRGKPKYNIQPGTILSIERFDDGKKKKRNPDTDWKVTNIFPMKNKSSINKFLRKNNLTRKIIESNNDDENAHISFFSKDEEDVTAKNTKLTIEQFIDEI